MRKLLILISYISLINPALAIEFNDDKCLELHGDISTGNFFRNAQTVENGFDGIIDYRLEAHAELAKLRSHRISTVTRLEGFGFYDGSSQFFDDPLIDLPELYIQDDFQIKGLDSKLVFGKFANRRFFDKNEINSDPFDIGERAFFSALANNNNVLSSIQTARDPDQLNSIQATGSYGFYLAIQDKDGEGLWNKWGFRQSLTVAQLDNFADNFYGISELSKNWGESRPGQINLGLVYAQEDVFRLDNENSYLLYSSITQRFTDSFSSYIRHGLLMSRDSSGQDYSANNIVAGAYYNISEKDSISSHIVWTESSIVPDSISHLNAWVHKFNPNLYATLFNTYRYNIAAATADGGDNNWFIGLNLTVYF